MARPSTGTRDGLRSSSSPPSRTRGRSSRPYRPRELREAGIAPAKALGQHFLTDRGVVRRIVDAAELGPGDTVVEVGPGLGVLTERLVEAAGRVIAVELDARLAGRLREKLDAPNLTVVNRDVLATAPAELLGAAGLPPETPYAVVSNLPYNIGTAVLRHFLESEWQPRLLVVMLQREVADSICAAPGGLSLVGVSVQAYARARHLFNVPPRSFYPPPKVTSGVIRLDVRGDPLVPVGEREAFFEVVRAGFSAPRKQLRNSLSQGLRRAPAEVGVVTEASGLDPRVRPQDLAVEDWLRLSRQIRATVRVD